MKKSLLKNNLKTIYKTRRRFLSILVMAFLGVGFFSGLVSTSQDMLDSLDRYLDESNMYDINIVSTLGLTDNDINALKEIEGVQNAYGIQAKDTEVILDEDNYICKIIEYNENINIPKLIKGKLPENKNECLIDLKYVVGDNTEINIGKKIVLKNEEKNDNEDSLFTTKELEIVGIVESPLYISNERGTTSLGNGYIDFYVYTKDDVINIDYFTEIALVVNGAKELETNSNNYLKAVNNVYQKIDEIKEERENERYNSIINEANEELNKAQKEFNEEKKNAEDKLKEAETQLSKAKKEIELTEKQLIDAENEIQKNEEKLYTEFSNAEKQLALADEEISSRDEELQQGKEELQQNKEQSNNKIAEINKQLEQLNENLKVLQNTKEELEKNNLDTTQINNQILEVQNTIKQLENGIEQIQTAIDLAEQKIITGEQELNIAKKELESKKTSFENEKKSAYEKLDAARQEIKANKAKINEAKEELEKNEKEYKEQKIEVENELNEAQEKLDAAKEDIKKIEKGKWYIQDRLDNSGYGNIFDAIQTMSNISKVFPVIFYIVAILISLTSMTRMVEEERTEIGTLKALGYTNSQIIFKYILYSLLASIIGGVIGMSIGFYLIPNIVWKLYSILYTIPEFYCTYRLEIGILGTVIAFLCIGGVTTLVAYEELKQMPSVLMRPKSPKKGKKIFLERITFIWKRLSFSKKITIRNIFRYKKRAIMTIVGIAGCTGLILTGFGIRDSVIDVPLSQFGDIFKYESSVSLLNTNGLNELQEYLENNKNIENYVNINATTATISNGIKEFDVTVFIPEKKEEINNICSLRDYTTNNDITLNDNGIIITDKVAEELNVVIGNQITYIDGDGIHYTFKVEGIVKNYVNHYIYLSKKFYEENISTYKTNMIMINTKNISKEEQDIISETILNIEGIASVTVTSNLIETIADMLNTINYVVIILIVASALLAFVVLYNLANINIGERQRELATLKVLGFYDNEVDNYINKESMIFTILGVLIGLIFGNFLTNILIKSIEIESLKFMQKILFSSYLWSAFITISFSFIVNIIVHFTLKKIDMIESLKSIE